MLKRTRDEGARPELGRPAVPAVDDASPGVSGVPPAGPAETVERTLVGRVLISVFVSLMCLTYVVTNLPTSQLKTDLGRITQPFANATGMNQNWTVFVSPRRTSAHVYARVEYASGDASTIPLSDSSGLGSYLDYRWQKYEQVIRLDSGQPLWADYVRFVADQAWEDGREPVRVSLIRRWSASNPPGPGPDRAPWQEYTMYSTTVGQAS